MAGTNSLEIEIHNLFQEYPSAEYVCQELLAKYERNEVVNTQEIEGISHFLISFGRFDLLQKFYLKTLNQKKVIQFPVGYLFECLIKTQQPITHDTLSFIEGLIAKQPDEITALQQSDLLSYSPSLSRRSQNLEDIYLKNREEMKVKLIEQLNKHRLYQLKDQEESVINQLIQLFPNDIEVGILKQAHLERKADDILSKFNNRKTLTKSHHHDLFEANDTQSQDVLTDLKKSLQELSLKLQAESPEQLYNLAIFTYQLELFELTIEILDLSPESHARDWLKAEALHECGRHLDLLKLIEDLEKKPSQKAEDAYGATYLKALAYYGLGQKDLAIKLMSSLTRAVPFYRSSEALLHEWKQS